MQSNTMFIGWNRAFPGHEAPAAECFNKVLGLLGAKQAEGAIESFEPVLLGPHGGDLNGFTLVRGAPEQLVALRADEGFLGLIIECGVHVDRFGVIDGYAGDALQQVMASWAASASRTE